MNRGITNLINANWFMTICSILYLLCWLFLFRPHSMPPIKGLNKRTQEIIGYITLIPVYISGIAGLIMMLKGVTYETDIQFTGIPFKNLCIFFSLIYVLLLIMTMYNFKRTPTVELLLIIGYILFESCILDYFYMIGKFDMVRVILSIIALVIVFLINIGCYIKHYNFPDKQAYINGCIPLILSGITSIIFNLFTIF